MFDRIHPRAPRCAPGIRRCGVGSNSSYNAPMQHSRIIYAAAVSVVLSLGLGCRAMTSSSPDPQAGVPLELAAQRAQTIRDLRYHLWFSIPAAASEPIVGREAVHFKLTDTSQPVVLAFEAGPDAIISITTHGKPIRAA